MAWRCQHLLPGLHRLAPLHVLFSFGRHQISCAPPAPALALNVRVCPPASACLPACARLPACLPAYPLLQKRKEFEDQARRVGRWNPTIWVKYAQWEEQQKDFRRARSVWERSLEVDYR